MTTTSPRGVSMDALIAAAHADGIRIWWRHLPYRDGQWSARHRPIWLDPSLTHTPARAVLAHELGHAALGHAGPGSPAQERAAWRYASTLLVTGSADELAESKVGPDPGALADELEVPRDVVLAFREVIAA